MGFRGIGTYRRGTWAICPQGRGGWVITCEELPDFREHFEGTTDQALEALRLLHQASKRLLAEDSTDGDS